MKLESKIALLRQTAWSREASEATLLELARSSGLQEVAAGASLFLEAEPVEAVFVLESGFARSYRFERANQREFTVDTFGPRQTLGIVGACLEPSRFTACAEMLKTGRVLRLSADVLRSRAHQDAAFAVSLLRHVASRQARLMDRLSQLVLIHLSARLAALLLEHASPEGWALPQNSVMAAQLGTVPELVSRKLGELYRRGWIRLEKRRVWLVDRAALERQAMF